MSFLPPSKVRQGMWIDWSQGLVLGSTITTTSTAANVVVAVLAIVVSLASVHLWHMLLFCFYQLRANKEAGDGLYRQQQTLLRALAVGGPEQAFWDFSRLSWTWRGKAHNSLSRSIGLALAALIFSLGALVASLSSSFILSTSTITVLVNSNNCGTFNPNQPQFEAYDSAVLTASRDYAKDCYLNDNKYTSCVRYVQPKINFTTTPAPCPFSKSMCIGSLENENPGVTLDTGYIDSNDDLGLNAVLQDRIQARKKTTCAPIKVSGFYNTVDAAGHAHILKGISDSEVFPGQQEFRLEYGTQPQAEGTFLSHFVYNSYLSNFTKEYVVLSQHSGPSYGSQYSTYKPIKQLTRSNADTILIWIFSNAVQYKHEVDDPVFSAHIPSYVFYEAHDRLKQPTFKPDYPLGTVACTEQYQFCVTASTGSLKCTSLGGLPTNASVTELGLNNNQIHTFDLIRKSMLGVDISIIGATKDGVLLSSDTVTVPGVQTSYIPDNQWKYEVDFWESYALSAIQNTIATHAIGPGIKGDNGLEAQFNPPPTAGGKRLCEIQKMKINGGFANISVFGLAFTITVAGIIVIMDLCLLKILVFLSRFYKFWGFNIDYWVQDGALQLQRKAYEGAGQGNWSRRNDEIPLVGRDDQLYNFKPELSSTMDEIDTLSSLSVRPSASPTEASVSQEKVETELEPTRYVITAFAESELGEIGAEATSPDWKKR